MIKKKQGNTVVFILKVSNKVHYNITLKLHKHHVYLAKHLMCTMHVRNEFVLIYYTAGIATIVYRGLQKWITIKGITYIGYTMYPYVCGRKGDLLQHCCQTFRSYGT